MTRVLTRFRGDNQKENADKMNGSMKRSKLEEICEEELNNDYLEKGEGLGITSGLLNFNNIS